MHQFLNLSIRFLAMLVMAAKTR